MKNNKKKLSKLLIPLLALSAVNVNAMEKPMKRNSTIGKLRRYQTDKFKNLKTKSDEFGNFVKQRKIMLLFVLCYSIHNISCVIMTTILCTEKHAQNILHKNEAN